MLNLSALAIDRVNVRAFAFVRLNVEDMAQRRWDPDV